MPADIVNLRRARKTKARLAREATAAEQRAIFGRSKGEKAKAAAERARSEQKIDAHRREREPE